MQMSFGDPLPTGQQGTWSASFSSGERRAGVAVIVVGSSSNGLMLYAAEPEQCGSERGPLVIALINVVVSSSRLSADTGRLTCNGLRFGSVTLTRQ